MKLTIHSKEISGANILKVEAGTNTPQGGDTGHGGRTLVRLTDVGGTDMRLRFRTHHDPNAYYSIDEPRQIELVFGGDSECGTLIEALEFAAEVLRSGRTLMALSTIEEDIE